ncbi:hypothetical protein B2J93_3981 [Marssonina coronariae]|uniref:Uncharacterized protein n=1 Tax=Diplocarpon coronariae TaxID=2795749 RepID=A0A218YV38_9HELO|nr:hypothetical protein B2J93_3981 [Marssonina coronariae]
MAHGIHVKSVAVVGAGAAGITGPLCVTYFIIIDSLLSLNTTVEDVAVIGGSGKGRERWRFTLRKHDFARDIDEWWHDDFDAVVLANGHYGVPFIPEVKGLKEYLAVFPGRVIHSKVYRRPLLFKNKKVLAIGNSASGHDLTAELATAVKQPVYQSRRSKSRWDGDEPPAGHAWKPTIKEFLPPGRIIFEDNPFEYQAIAIARLFAGTQARDLPILEEQEKWEQEREKGVHTQQIKFHDVEWGTGETLGWFGELYQIAGLRQLTGEGRNLPVTGEDVRWAIEHLRKYSEPEPRRHLTVGGSEDQGTKVMTPDALVRLRNEGKSEWVVVKTRPRVPKKDPLAFI